MQWLSKSKMLKMQNKQEIQIKMVHSKVQTLVQQKGEKGRKIQLDIFLKVFKKLAESDMLKQIYFF